MLIPDLDSDAPIDDNSGIFDTDLRRQIVHEIDIHTKRIDVDISAQLRRQRLKTAAIISSVLIVLILLGVGINAIRTYIENNTFIIRAQDIAIETGKRYTYAVSRNGEFLLDAFLIVNEPTTQNGHTIYHVQQIAPGANENRYWSIREDGFYQFLDPKDAYPQIFIPLPLRPNMKWTATTYPNERYSYAKQTVQATFVAGKEVLLDLPIGPITAIEIIGKAASDDDSITIWVSKEAPIAKLNVDPDDPTYVAELSQIDTVQSP